MLARHILCYAQSKEKKKMNGITTNEMKFMKSTAGYTRRDHICNEDVLQEVQSRTCAPVHSILLEKLE